MRLNTITALILSALLAGLLLPNVLGLENGTSNGNWSSNGNGTLQVALDVYSGRENPDWNLTPGEEETFLKSLKALNRTDAEFISAGLGYRGFIVEGTGLEGYDRVSVYKGVVLAQAGNRSSRFEDKDQSLERWLLDTGKDSLDRDLYAQISSEIGNNQTTGRSL